MSNSDKNRDKNLDPVNEALVYLAEVPTMDNETWESGRAAFLSQMRQLQPETVSPSIFARLKSWIASFDSMLIQKIPARKEVNMTSLATILITISAIFALGVGGVDAAQSSLPGAPLYPLKTSWEGIQLYLTINPDAQVERAMLNAYNRVQEGIKLANQGQEIPAELANHYQSSLKFGFQIANGLDEPNKSQLLTLLNTQLAHHQRLLTRAMTQTQIKSSSPQAQLGLMLQTMEQIQEQVRLRINQQGPDQGSEGAQNQYQNQNLNQNQNPAQIQDLKQSNEPNQGNDPLQEQNQTQEQTQEQNQTQEQTQEQNQTQEQTQEQYQTQEQDSGAESGKKR